MERTNCQFCGKLIGRKAEAELWVSSDLRPAECERGSSIGYHLPAV